MRSERVNLPDLPQETLTGQRPGFVLLPTRQRQVIVPPRLAPRPCARETTVS
jgi:hypothetical protein